MSSTLLGLLLSTLALRGDPEPAPSAARVELSAVAADPSPWLGHTVAFAVQLDAELETWSPWTTRFGLAEHVGFRAWADEQRPWLRADFEGPVGRLFARRDGEPARALRAGQRFARFEVTARVAQVLGGQAWLEVVAVRPLPRSLTEGTLIHASRAVALMDEEQWGLALEDLERALAASMPERARAELERLAAVCRERRARS